MKKFADSINIINEFNFLFINKLIDNNDTNGFIKYYQNFQFTLTIEQRKKIQNKIKNQYDDIPLIKNNFIKDNINSTKTIFINLCNDLIKIYDIGYSKEKNIAYYINEVFLNNNIYFKENFKSLIPTKFGNSDIKFNKLIFEIADFFLF